jgi:hypothetical protein
MMIAVSAKGPIYVGTICMFYRSIESCLVSIVARNLKNVVPQKQNAICKTRAQYANCNCAFELFKAHCIAKINAKNASFHQKIL